MDLELLADNGVFSATDARKVGIDTHALDRLIREGRCIRLTRGWYAPVGAPPDAEQLHRLRALALGRHFRERAGLSHYSRLLTARVATFGVDLATVHLTLPSKPRADGHGSVTKPRRPTGVASRRPGLAIHRPVAGLTAAPGGGRKPWGVPLAWAIVQAGLEAGPESALVSADSALRANLVTLTQVSEAVARFAGHPGIVRTRPALAHADGRHESPGETRAAYLLRGLGYCLEPQAVVIAEGRRYRADFRITGTRVLVEFDGAVKYDSGETLFAEKQREDALRRAGWIVVRVVWRDLSSPAVVRQRVEAALAASAA